MKGLDFGLENSNLWHILGRENKVKVHHGMGYKIMKNKKHKIDNWAKKGFTRILRN